MVDVGIVIKRKPGAVAGFGLVKPDTPFCTPRRHPYGEQCQLDSLVSQPELNRRCT